MRKPMLVMTASKCLLHGETIQCDFVPFLQTSTFQTLKVLWALYMSSSVSGHVIGWAILAALYFSEINWEFPWLGIWNHCLAGMFTQGFIFNILGDGSRFSAECLCKFVHITIGFGVPVLYFETTHRDKTHIFHKRLL